MAVAHDPNAQDWDLQSSEIRDELGLENFFSSPETTHSLHADDDTGVSKRVRALVCKDVF